MTGYRALCNDFFVDTKITLKLGMPQSRDSVLHFFERMSQLESSLKHIRRFKEEVVLESREPTVANGSPMGIALRQREMHAWYASLGDGEDVINYHHKLYQIAPAFLGISHLDIDSFELIYVFEFQTQADHDMVISDALFVDCGFSQFSQDYNIHAVDPLVKFALTEDGSIQSRMHVRPRGKNRKGRASAYQGEPLVVEMAITRYGPFASMQELQDSLSVMQEHAEEIASQRLVPYIINPINHEIANAERGS